MRLTKARNGEHQERVDEARMRAGAVQPIDESARLGLKPMVTMQSSLSRGVIR